MAIEAEIVKSGYWLAEEESSFPAINIKTNLFTHLFCAFAGLDPKTYEVVIPRQNLPPISSFSGMVKLKKPDIKTILSIGTRDGSDAQIFAQMVTDLSHRKSFIHSSIRLARLYGFDGLDLHWLYPSNESDVTNLGLLLKEWHDSVVAESQQMIQKTQLLLVSTVYYLPNLPSPNPLRYPVDSLKENLDWINVQAYDFYTPKSSPFETGPAHAFQNITNLSLSGEFGLSSWIEEHQFPPEKTVIGLPFYGWAWLLRDPKNYDVISPANGVAKGPHISSDGRIDYGAIKEFISDFNAPTEFSEVYVATYSYHDTTWITHDDEKSITRKSCIAKKKFPPLRGYAAWHIGGDDEYNTLGTAVCAAWGAWNPLK